MRKLILHGAIGILAIIMILATPLVTYASPGRVKSSNFLNSGNVSKGAKLVLSIHYSVVNDEDNGNYGYWALDNYTKNVQIWLEPNGTYYVVAKYAGSWQTFAGALSPNAGLTEKDNAHGTFDGGYTATFTSTGLNRNCKNGNLGTYDFGGTETDILLGSYGNGQIGDTRTFDYLSYCFKDYGNFTYINWGWRYKYRYFSWNDYKSVRIGEILT